MKNTHHKEHRTGYMFFLIFVILSVGIIIAGYFAYSNYGQSYRVEVERQLSVVADLKEHELVQWRKERLGDANVFYNNIVFSGLAKRYFANQTDADAKKKIKALMRQVQSSYSYSRICLHDAAGVERISVPEGKIHTPFIFSARTAEVLKSGKVVFQDFYRDENDNKVYLTIFIPVLDENDTSRVYGVLAMRIDPEQSLYPLIRRWLTPSRTAETLISRREGTDILYLNNLKYQKNTALNLRVSMEKKELPSVKAALGQQGIIEGVDYRGVPVLADVRKIPDSPWFMVTRIDLSEVNAPVSERLWTIFIIVGLLLVSAGAGAGFLQRQQRVRFYLEQYKTDEALRDSEERYRTTMMSVGDGVITTDTEGRLELLNPVAEALTGWRQEEARTKPLEEVFRIINEETRQIVENPVRRVMREGIIVGLANHSVLIAKGGTEHPIADSGAPIRNKKGEITGVVLVFRDQTEERAAQKALRESQEKYYDTVKYLDDGYYSCTMDGLVIEHNKAFNRILGFDVEKNLKGAKLPDFWQNPDDRKDYLREFMDKGIIRNYLINAKTISGAKIVVMANSHLVKDENEKSMRIEGTFIDFTERKKAEEALRDATENLERRVLERTIQLAHSKQLLDETGRLARVGGWEIDLKKNVLSFSDVTKQIHEVDPEYQPTLEAAINFYAPEAVPVISEAVRRAIEEGEPYDVELQLITAKQNRIWVRAIGEAYRENGEIVKIGGVFQDINVRKLAEIEVRKKSEQLQLLSNELEIIIDSIPGLVFYKDTNNRFIRVNKYICDAYKMSKKQLEGIHLNDLHTKEQAQAYYEADLQVIRSRQPKINIDEPWETETGMRWVNTSKIPYKNEKGEVIGVIGVSMDVTERKLAEEELKKHRDHLEELVKERTNELATVVSDLKRSNEELEQFAYVASHDLQEPLRMVSSFTQLIERRYKDKLDKDANDFINFAVDGANRMQRLINDLLDYSRVTTRGKTFVRCDVGSIIGQVFANLQQRIEESHAIITQDDLPVIEADESQMVRLFQNLIDNALKFRSDAHPCVHISTHKEGAFYIFTVSDNGIGIDLQYAERIFQVFQRLNTSQEYPGTGIGLAICKRIIERHGGRIWIESEVGNGSKFFFTIPIK